MSRVAIIGSCITRDLWPVRIGPDILYVSRTSLPSLLARPVARFKAAAKAPGGLPNHLHRALLADLQKTALARLVAFQPSHLIFDFIDERFDLLSVDGTLVTLSWELETSGYLSQAAFRRARPVPRLGAGCERLWSEAALEAATLLEATPLRSARVILHSARWAELSREADGLAAPIREVAVLPGRAVSIAEHNALLARYEARFLARFPQATVVEAPEHRLADPEHRWGLSPFHYVPEYYEEIWNGLRAAGITAAAGEPSAPAASAPP